MSKLRSRGEAIRKYILNNVEKHPDNIARKAAEKFDISRQAANKHLRKLVEEESLTVHGRTKSRVYKLRPLLDWSQTFRITPKLAEDVVWRDEVEPRLGKMPDNVNDIWHYGFTEMFNNAIDHSAGDIILVHLSTSATNTQIALYDNGIGIFKKIQQELNLLDERHSVLELAKGKLTTDPKRHTGEGIFFSSRMFDDFQILSGDTYFSHKFGEQEDWILESDKFSSGTAVWMKLSNHTSRTAKKIFDKFTSGDDFGFNKTVVPVKLAQYGDDKLISRSQAKRLIYRFDRFKVVILDFKGVDSIGQAFADEVFRVFATNFPNIDLSEINTKPSVKNMIQRARSRL
jgi:hypothetical protein